MIELEKIVELAEIDIINRDYDTYDNLWNDDWPEPTIEDYERWNQEFADQMEDEFQDQPWHQIQCFGIHSGKLESFINESNQYKLHDKKFNHPDVIYNIGWYDPIHNFCNNKGFGNARNKIDGIIRKLVKNGGTSASNIVYKLKSNIDYKSSDTFRKCARNYIRALQMPQKFDYSSTEWESMFGEDYVYQDGMVMTKADARKYWGYSETCKICGKDHGN